MNEQLPAISALTRARFRVLELRQRTPDRVAHAIARHLPARITYWCTIVAGAHATTGQYGSTVVPDVTFCRVLERYGNDQLRGRPHQTGAGTTCWCGLEHWRALRQDPWGVRARA